MSPAVNHAIRVAWTGRWALVCKSIIAAKGRAGNVGDLGADRAFGGTQIRTLLIADVRGYTLLRRSEETSVPRFAQTGNPERTSSTAPRVRGVSAP